MVNGTWLDFYCIGPLHGQEDRLGLDRVRDIYRFHAEHEKWLTDTEEIADVGLVIDGVRRSDDYWGMFKILSQSHIPFNLVSLNESQLSKYPTLIVPFSDHLNSNHSNMLDEYVQNGGRLLLCGPVPQSLQCAGLRDQRKIDEQKGTYIRIRDEDRQHFGQPILDKLDLVYLKGDLWTYEANDDVNGLLRYIPPAMFGPPEKCYYTEVSDIPCFYSQKYGKGAVACIPWRIGEHYENQGHQGHAALVKGALNELQSPQRLKVNTSSLVEVNHRKGKKEQFEWISLINHSGLIDEVLHQPVPIHKISISVKPSFAVKKMRLLKAGKSIPFNRRDNGWIECEVPQLDYYEVVLLEG